MKKKVVVKKGRQAWTVPRDWEGQTAFIIGGGPSAAAAIGKLAGKRVIAVNSAWRSFPEADYLFFNDERWWGRFAPPRGKFAGKVVTTNYEVEASHRGQVHWLKKVHPEKGLIAQPATTLTMKRTSVAGAIHLAIRLGASVLVLLGVDGKLAADGTRHHHGDTYPWPLIKAHTNIKGKRIASSFESYAVELANLAPHYTGLGVTILNANPHSAITAFPFTQLELHL